ncbi:MAG: hypothetical protein AAGC44_03475 [Planctomycetota bacterium]
MKSLTFVPILIIVAVIVMLSANASAQFSPLTEEQLRASATHVIRGSVSNVFVRTERKDNWEYTFGVVEVDVRQVSKGQDIEASDRVFVRYWHKTWLGDPTQIPSDHAGNENIPSKGDTADIFLMGDRQTGFDVFSPNGFFRVIPKSD